MNLHSFPSLIPPYWLEIAPSETSGLEEFEVMMLVVPGTSSPGTVIGYRYSLESNTPEGILVEGAPRTFRGKKVYVTGVSGSARLALCSNVPCKTRPSLVAGP